jgi:aminoglycoside phosphotransferase (APT) family kinase protein
MVLTTPNIQTLRSLFSTAGLCRDVVGVAPLAGGENSRAIEVRFLEPAAAFVLKLYPDHLRWKMAKEVFVYRSLQRDPALPTPEILLADDSCSVIPEAFVIMTKRSGTLAAGVVEPHRTNLEYMQHQFAKKLGEFAELGGDDHVRRRAERGVDSSVSLLTGCSQAVLFHDDLHEGNVLVHEREGGWHVSGVLDVENAVAIPPRSAEDRLLRDPR